MRCTWSVSLLIGLMGCVNSARDVDTGCGVRSGLKLCLHATRESKDAVIVDVAFEKLPDYAWSLGVAGSVFITWYDQTGEVVGRDVFKMIFDEAFQSGEQRLDESNARFHPPKSARYLSAKLGQSLLTERARIRE